MAVAIPFGTRQQLVQMRDQGKSYRQISGETGRCPDCKMAANKVHSFYKRTLTDLPICGKAVSLRIHLRKFFCRNDQCGRKIFTQTAPAYFCPYARRLNRVQQPLQAIALQTGARPAARLSELIGQPVSHSTLLRISRKTPVQNQPTPIRLGVDDFAFRKGRRYGTILTVRRAIDLDGISLLMFCPIAKARRWKLGFETIRVSSW